jgi:serine/threonine protein kinase
MSAERETELLRAQRQPRRDRPELLSAGTVVGAWRVVRHVATGGCGSVYEVAHRVLERPAAVKVLHADLASSPAMTARFILEARAVNLIRHPGIVDIFDLGELSDGRPFMAMELLDEDNLEDRLVADGRCRPEDALALFETLCDALAGAHARGIIHRDIKARNIGFVRGSASLRDAKVLDFGIAKLLEPTAAGDSSPSQRVGTPQSMSPEQIRGAPVDARTDVYGLGVLLFHVLTGRYPFESDDSLEIERMHLEAPPPTPSQLAPITPELDRLVSRAMAKRPEDRPSSVGDLVDELRAAIAGTTGAERVVPVVAVHVDIRVDEPSDAALDRIAAHQAEVADRLVAGGFAIALATACSTLAVQVLPDSPEQGAEILRHTRTLAAAIAHALRERVGAIAGSRVVAAVRTTTASIRGGARGADLEITGGDVFDTRTWATTPGAG